MNRISVFLLGLIAGAGGLYTAENYYIIRANEGFHVVPKIAAKIEFPYRDIRNYTVEQWQDDISLGAAIIKSENKELMVDSLSGVRHKFETMLRAVGS